VLRSWWRGAQPGAALILGSGWSDVAEALSPLDSLPYSEIPGLGTPGVAGHAGRLLRAEPCGVPTLIFQGRRHFYEGLGWEPVVFPVFVCKSLGVQALCLTNAAGGIRRDLRPGDLMIIEDHIHRIPDSPLIGAHDPFWGVRFPDQTRVYDPAFCKALEEAGKSVGVKTARGIYLSVSGPAYETPAEIRAYATLGADAIGMSTTPEAMLAHAAGLRVCALSCITNLAAGISPTPLTHEEVTAATAEAMPRMQKVLTRFWERELKTTRTRMEKSPE
ncbi:MAG: purine-nucleoside phosphorylase, partial [Kiritimatiellia bacterium]|nr:purine-nucleoside phosphorylase [Kiritimatiellia bacterium]